MRNGPQETSVAGSPEGKYPERALRLQVRQITRQADNINSYEMVDPKGKPLPPFTAGAHIDFFFRDGSVRQYSLCNDPAERHRYLIAVLREEHGRGGSQALFERVHVQRHVYVGKPRNNFPLVEGAKRHLLLAGGIGVTPMMAMIHRLRATGADFVMHYCTKTPENTAFRDTLKDLVEDGQVIIHHDGGDPTRGLDISALLKDYEEGTHLYICGPAGFMRACQAASEHWPKGTVHFEYFSAAASPKRSATEQERTEVGDEAIGIGFQVKINSSGAVFSVPNDKSIVEVLAENGIDIEVSCESGLCGTCKTRYLSGEVEHRDLVLSEEEQLDYLTPCCSRVRSGILVLDI